MSSLNVRVMSLFFLFSLFQWSSLPRALAQYGAGNGGHLVEVDSTHLYLLDFYEGGMQEKPFVHTTFENMDVEEKRFQARAKDVLMRKGFYDPDKMGEALTSDLLEVLISEVRYRNQFLAVISLYNWSWVDAPLVAVRGLRSVVDLSQVKVWVGANRLDNTITISKPFFKRLSELNKVGLIMHELIYAMIKPASVKNSIDEQRSEDARMITRGFFNDSFNDLASYARNGVPFLTLVPPQSTHGDYLFTNGGDTIIAGSGNQTASIQYGPFAMLSQSARDIQNGSYLSLNRGDLERDRADPTLLQQDCEYIMSLPHQTAYLLSGYLMSIASFKDYLTAEGPNKYISFEYKVVTGSGLTLSGPGPQDHYEAKGLYKLHYETQAACEKDLFSEIEKIDDELKHEYDYQEFYSTP